MNVWLRAEKLGRGAAASAVLFACACNDGALTTGPAALDVSPAAIDFGVVQTVDEAIPQTVTVRNNGGHDLYVTSVRIEPEGLGYIIEEDMPTEDDPWRLKRDTYIPFEVAFTPTSFGDQIASIVVESSGGNGSVDLSGHGFEIREDEYEQGEYGGALADILFVVDNSGSMGDDQVRLGDSFDTFIDWIATAQTDVFYRIAVTTTDMTFIGEKGKFVGNPMVLKHSTPNLVSQFKSNVQVGSNGSASEKGLDASVAALSEPVLSQFNTGFLRAAAKLYVVYVSDEEDDGIKATSTYIDFFNTLKGDPDLVHFTAIAGEPPTGCANSFGNGEAAFRYADVVNATGGIFDTICQADFGTTLQSLAFDVTQNAPVGFQLTAVPVDGTLEVLVDGSIWPDNQWSYDDVGYTVSFIDPWQPPAESIIVFKYEVAGPLP